MALATTCPQCKTSFRVVPDQLKLRRGFVRCGRCRNVFAGIDHLRYVDEGQLREGQSRAHARVGAPLTDADEDVEYIVLGTPDSDALASDARDDPGPHDDAAAQPDNVHSDVLGDIRDDAPDDGSEADEPVDSAIDEAPPRPERSSSPVPAGEAQDDDAARFGDAVAHFAHDDRLVDDAEGESAIDYFSTRRSRGFADRRGIAIAFGVLALAIALVLQFVVGQRATIAASAPKLAPILGAVLAPFGLSIGAPSDLDALTIESFELQASANPDVLEMRALLRNRADHPVRWPSMQLTLTDRSDRVLVRRTLDPEDYLREAATTPGEGVPAQTEWPLQLALEARDLHLAGYDYRVRLFYP